MAFIGNQQIQTTRDRTYHVYVPDNPVAAQLPAILVFHGGGQAVSTIAERWGVNPPNPVPPLVENFILVFPESHPDLGERWIHHRGTGGPRPELDLRFVDELLDEITTAGVFPTPGGQSVSADPERVYAAGFSNGGGMVWQIAYSNPALIGRFRGFAAVGKALDPEKIAWYRSHHGAPPAAPFMYIHGTGDGSFSSPKTLQEVPIDTTFPANTVREMRDRNGVGAGPATTQLVAGSTNATEVVAQLHTGTEAFANVTIVNGGHNWPTPTTNANPPVAQHVNATEMIVAFWRNHAGLP
jgi:polyhydroxybutyrate depolymerase